jgi:TatD DNase family protein
LELKFSNKKFFTTVGVHPTRCNEFLQNECYEDELKKLIEKYHYLNCENKNYVVAIGECGLDYDRLHFCEKEIQQKYFELQIQFAIKYQLPMFLHNRNSTNDLCQILSKYLNKLNKSIVIHSFDGSIQDLEQILNLDQLLIQEKNKMNDEKDIKVFIGINGCSMKTSENIEVIKKIPIEKLMIETDAPWCEIRPSHESFKYLKSCDNNYYQFQTKKKEKWQSNTHVKSRNEPDCLINILKVIAKVKQMDENELAQIIYENTMKVFFSK